MTRSRVLAALAVVAGVGAAAAAFVLIGPGATTVAVPRFAEVSVAAGLTHTYEGEATDFLVGGGVATFDCDGDPRPEVYLAGGSAPAALFRNDSPRGGPLRFSRIPSPTTDLTDVTGAYPLDVDGDGLTDLAVLRVGEDVLLKGLGACAFERANERWSFDGDDARTMAFAATWEDESTFPTLAFGHYINRTSTGAPIPPCPDNRLVQPDPSGTAFSPPEPLSPGFCPLSMLFSDWDGSGRRDLRISNDRQYYTEGQEQLWRMAPDDGPAAYTGADGWKDLRIWGMGIASHDLTGDGLPEVYLTSQGDNKLQTLAAGPAQPTYMDIAVDRGVNAAQPTSGGETLPSTAWHPAFADVNDDGRIDLFVTKGNVGEQEGYATKDPSELLLGQADGTFTSAAEAAGLVRFDRGRGAAVVDLDLDGLLDIIQVDLSAPVELWHNVGAGEEGNPEPMGGWLGLRLEQPGANRDAIGSWLEIRIGDVVDRREMTVGGGHLSGHLGWTHVGLGSAKGAEVRAIWPDGEVGPWHRIEANRFATIRRDAQEVETWQP